MAIRNLTQIVSDAIAFIQSKIPGLSTLPGTVARDVVIESPAQEFNRAYQELGRISLTQNFENPDSFINDELANRAADVGLTHLPGTASTVPVVFRTPTLTADITINVGTQISTSPTQLFPDIISFRTVSTGQFLLVNAPSYLNPLTGLYELEINVQAEATGSGGNVSAGAINTITTNITGAPSLTVINNLAASGGADGESNTSLAQRIRTKLAGNNVGTENGVLSLIRTNSLVLDSLIVKPGDPELLRNQFGNSFDIVLIGEILRETAEAHVFNPSILDVPLSRQPARIVSLIKGIVAGNPFTFTEGIDYTVSIDNTSMFVGTTEALSKITFLGTGSLPDNGSTIIITYTYNELISNLQSTVESDINKIIGADPLVKEATKVLIQISATIRTFSGYTHADVATSATTAVSTLLSNLKLGIPVDQSDLIVAIQDTPGVDAVDIPITIAVKRPADPGFIFVSNVSISRTEYGRPDTITIV